MSRTDFEAAYIERYGHRPRGWNDDFQVYQDAHANGAWFGWQARAAGIEAKAAPVGECKCSMSISVLRNGCRYCQPQKYIDILSEWLVDARTGMDELQAENAKLRAILEVNDE